MHFYIPKFGSSLCKLIVWVTFAHPWPVWYAIVSSLPLAVSNVIKVLKILILPHFALLKKTLLNQSRLLVLVGLGWSPSLAKLVFSWDPNLTIWKMPQTPLKSVNKPVLFSGILSKRCNATTSSLYATWSPVFDKVHKKKKQITQIYSCHAKPVQHSFFCGT